MFPAVQLSTLLGSERTAYSSLNECVGLVGILLVAMFWTGIKNIIPIQTKRVLLKFFINIAAVTGFGLSLFYLPDALCWTSILSLSAANVRAAETSRLSN